MPRNRDKKGKKRVVLSLAEFNEDAGLGGANPELASLPSAPKAPEEWEAEGGRPEYNSRGYKERNQTGRDRRPRDGDDDDDHDWSRRGPLDASDSSFGAPAGERDWGGMRGEGVSTDAQPERDWGGMRRGPVDAAFEGRGSGGAGGEERNWNMRKGPVEAEVAGTERGAVTDEAWGSARRQAVEPVFNNGSRGDDVADWGAERKVAVEADFGDDGGQQPRDWGVRKGPIEAAAPSKDQDWSGARGRAPVEAEGTRQTTEEGDWTEMRRAPVEAETSPAVAEGGRGDVDWSARRGPLEGKGTARPTRDVDFAGMRKGAKLRDLEGDGGADSSSERRGSGGGSSEKSIWRRVGTGVPALRGHGQTGRPGYGRPISTGSDGGARDQGNWRTGRRAPADEGAAAGDTETIVTDVAADSGAVGEADEGGEVGNDNWTTVRANPKRGSAQSRRGGYGDGARDFGRDGKDGNARWRGGSGRGGSSGGVRGGFGRGGGDGPRPIRPGFGTDGAAPKTSTSSPVTSATSES